MASNGVVQACPLVGKGLGEKKGSIDCILHLEILGPLLASL